MEEGNYRGRIKRLEKFQTVVVQKLSKLVVICMLDVARKEFLEKSNFRTNSMFNVLGGHCKVILGLRSRLRLSKCTRKKIHSPMQQREE